MDDVVCVVISANGKLKFRLRHAMVLYMIKGFMSVTPMSTPVSKKKEPPVRFTSTW